MIRIENLLTVNRLTVTLLLVTSVVLTACSVYPVYQAPATGTTLVYTADLPNPWICVDNRRYILPTNSDGYSAIPFGNRVTIGGFYEISSFTSTSTCTASISLFPSAGETYYSNWEFAENRCRIEIYRFNDNTRSGLAFEKSLEGGKCD